MSTVGAVISCVCCLCISDVLVEYEYSGLEEDELTIKPGEVITNVVVVSDGWWEGDLNGKRGVFPDNFVRVSIPCSIG